MNMACRYRQPSHLIKAALPIALLAAFPCTAQTAARVDYEIGTVLRHSDNINQSASNPIADSMLAPRLYFEAAQEGSTIQFTADGSFDYTKYLRNTFSSEFRGYFTGKLKWIVAPERMDVTFEDYLSRQPVNVQSAFGPGNQQQVNLFVTGPSFYVRLGDTTRSQLDLRYSSSYAQVNNNFDGNRYNVAARIQRELSATQQLSANIEATQVRFNQPITASDYNRRDAYVGYSNTLRRMKFDIDAGYSKVKLLARDDEFSAPLFRGRVDWQVSPRGSVNASVKYQIADAAQDLGARAGLYSDPIISDVLYSDVLAGPEVFRQRWFDMSYQYSGERLSWSVRPYYERLHYLDAPPQDLRSNGGLFELDYRLRPLLTLSIQVAKDSRRFSNDGRTDHDSTVDFGLVNQFTRHWDGRIDLEHRKRDSSSIGQSYSENVIVVSVTYKR